MKKVRHTRFIFSFAFIVLASLLFVIWITSYFIENWGSTYRSTSSVADFNGDGLLDVVIAHARYESPSGNLAESESTVFAHTTLWTGQEGGKFTPQTIAYSPSAAVGDLDGDGDMDILTTDRWQLQILLNQGGAQGMQAGRFDLYPNPIRLEGEPIAAGSVLLVDLDGDGHLDGFVPGGCSPLIDQSQGGVAAKFYQPSPAWIWFNHWEPPGWLDRQTRSLVELGDLYMRAALGDLDGDGSPDVFAGVRAACPGGYDGHPDLVLLNDGHGSLRDSGQRLGQADSKSVALGDLDGDGDLDALVGSGDGTRVWINQGGEQAGLPGEFELARDILPSRDTHHIYLADFDGDGDLDALVAGVSQAGIWWNDGLASFTHSGRAAFRFSPRHGLAVGDFNADGFSDIFAGAYNDDYKLWLNRGDGVFRIAGS